MTWTDQEPSLRVWWLAFYNAMRRWPLLGPVFALSLVAIGGLVGFSPLRPGVAAAASHPFAVLALAGFLFAMTIHRRRRRLARNRHRDWLAALPSDLPLTARAAYLPFVGWACFAFALFTAGVISKLPLVSAETVVFASAAGLLAAVAAVAIVAALQRRTELRTKRPTGPARIVPPASRYAVVHRRRARWATSASLAPLGYWPMAQARFSERPKIKARVLGPYLVGVPLGLPAAVVLAGALVWLVTMHLLNLIAGVVRVAFAAAWWLAPTPVGAARFTLAVTHRALVGELAGCALLVFVAVAAAGPRAFHLAVGSALLWIAAACLLSVAACLIAVRSKSVARSVVHRWMR